MKSNFFLFIAALVITATASSQSTVDSITAKYKMVQMPGALTIEKTFPVLGVYQLGNTDASMAGMNANSSNMNSTGTSNGTTTNTTTNSSTNTPGNSSNTSTDMQSATGVQPVAANTVVITLDSVNKGMVWVEGLPQGKFKAFLKKSPATYRILAQKTESGKQISEGTLMLDPATNQLNIALGKNFDEADPAGIFALNTAATATSSPTEENTVKIKVKTPTSKTKSKVTFYTATKMDAMGTPGATGTFDSQLQQSQTQQQPAQQQHSTQLTPTPTPAPAPQTP